MHILNRRFLSNVLPYIVQRGSLLTTSTPTWMITASRLFSSTSICLKKLPYQLEKRAKKEVKRLLLQQLEAKRKTMPPAKTDTELVRALSALPGKIGRSSVYPAPADPSISIRSWKMSEFKYYEVPSPFPTLARGLFTRELSVEDQDGEKKYKIVARGYDKFFNIGEVPWTEWDTIEKHTSPPYNLSVKSNGCIIFIAALTPDKLLITSKHALGPSTVGGGDLSHAQAGEGWLRKYLAAKGREEADLAKVLWENNWTAIAELCDDNFEEHVLGYPPELTGLHLHGLNKCSVEFETMPAETVDAFAEEWGFIKTAHITLDTVKEVREFTSACAEKGEWNGEAVEGFVVRTRVAQPSPKSPYHEGSSFFFKVKFDEPYMMYRDWREVTKILLSKGLDPNILPKSKLKRAETKLYVKWVIEEIKQNPKAFVNYTKGKGIIATREKYLALLKSGMTEETAVETVNSSQGPKKFSKTIIVPVAIPGCGKTVVSVALARIFGFGHTQSDDVHNVKKPAPVFIKNVVNLLKTHDVVIADKNNHLIQHRQSLREASYTEKEPVRLLALHWALDKPQATIHRVCGDRIQDRGDNHQTLRADKAKSHEQVLWMFLSQYQELTGSEVDNIIDMDLEEDLESAVRRAAQGCVEILGLPEPTEQQIADGLAAVASYVPAMQKPPPAPPKDPRKAATQDAQAAAKKKNKPPRFYGMLPEIDLVPLLDSRLAEPDAPAGILAWWETLKKERRYATKPHVTIIHGTTRSEDEGLWTRCGNIAAMGKPPVFKARIGHILWNKRVMVLTVEDFALDDPGEKDPQNGVVFVSQLPEFVRNRLHITVGTYKESIKPVEGKALVESWREKDTTQNIEELPVSDIEVLGRIKPMNG